MGVEIVLDHVAVMRLPIRVGGLHRGRIGGICVFLAFRRVFLGQLLPQGGTAAVDDGAREQIGLLLGGVQPALGDVAGVEVADQDDRLVAVAGPGVEGLGFLDAPVRRVGIVEMHRADQRLRPPGFAIRDGEAHIAPLGGDAGKGVGAEAARQPRDDADIADQHAAIGAAAGILQNARNVAHITAAIGLLEGQHVVIAVDHELGGDAGILLELVPDVQGEDAERSVVRPAGGCPEHGQGGAAEQPRRDAGEAGATPAAGIPDIHRANPHTPEFSVPGPFHMDQAPGPRSALFRGLLLSHISMSLR
ncbi:MAG: hypothetical protein K0R27_5143 [Xanthobacteraceae bacterium]|nr:hypothetical protein [Xanthobacteraceae bacterium]